VETSPRTLRKVLIERARVAREGAEAQRACAVAAARRACESLVAGGSIGEAWLVGSAAWGGFGAGSDLDVVVRGLRAAAAAEVADELARAAGVHVDLLRWEEIPPSLQARAIAEGTRLA
jgi:predicted nucleotidyltransferase